MTQRSEVKSAPTDTLRGAMPAAVFDSLVELWLHVFLSEFRAAVAETTRRVA